MFAQTAFDYLQYMGVGLVLVPFFLVSKAAIIKTRSELKNRGLGLAAFFLAVNITFIFAPVGILLATYIDSGTGALLIASLTFLIAFFGAHIYDKIIKRTFFIRIDEETFYLLCHRAKDEGVSIKDLIVGRIRKE